MENLLELFVNGYGINDTAIGQIDLYGDEPISLTISIQDVKDISKRNSTFSQNFTIPANKNNNILLNHIFNIGSDASFDPRKKTPCFILNDSVTVFTGNLQLTKINVQNTNVISYDIVVFGEVIDLVKTLGESLLTDLDFSELDHTFNVENIVASWTANTDELGYYYPLIDYGYDLSLNDLNNKIPNGGKYNGIVRPTGGLDTSIFVPAISSKYLFDKIFSTLGFTYTSDFLESDTFTQTIIPFNGTNKTVLPETYMDEFRFKAGLNSNIVHNIPFGIYWNGNLTCDNDSTNGNFDNGTLYNTSTYKYTADRYSAQSFTANIKFSRNVGASPPIEGGSQGLQLDVRFFRSTKGVFHVGNWHNGDVYNAGDVIDVSFTCPELNNPLHPEYYPIQPGEQFYIDFIFYGQTPFQPSAYTIYADGTNFFNTVLPELIPDSQIFYNYYIPKNIKQIDFIKSIITMFNLMVIPTKNDPKRLEIIPRNDYYRSGIIKDWTYKVDHSTKIEQTLLSEQQNKQILFSYKPDKDYYNSFYTESTNRIYGDHKETIDNEWVDGVKKIEIIFSPTPVDKVYDANDIFLPIIASRSDGGPYQRTDHNIRFLRKRPLPLDSVDSIRMIGMAAQFNYPYAGHLDHPYNATEDYNFGMINFSFYDELNAITNNNLVEHYWRDYLENINDKNSKLIKLKVLLTPDDISRFNYNDIIYLEGLTEDGGQYFTVNKITYIATSNTPSVVELIKLKRSPNDISNSIVDSLHSRSIGSVTSLALGNRNKTLSSNSLIVGEGNNISEGSTNGIIFGDNNTISTDANNVIMIGTNGKRATHSNTIYIGPLEITPGGKLLIKFNDIDSGEDTVLNPFNTGSFNDIDSGQDSVLGIGGTVPINDIDSGEDVVYIP